MCSVVKKIKMSYFVNFIISLARNMSKQI